MLRNIIKMAVCCLAGLFLMTGCRACGCGPGEGPRQAARRVAKKPEKPEKEKAEKKPDTKAPEKTAKGEKLKFKDKRLVIKPGVFLDVSPKPTITSEDLADPRLEGRHPRVKKALKILEHYQKKDPRYLEARKKAIESNSSKYDQGKTEIGVPRVKK